MSTKKISAMPAATTPNGTELVPIVQGGVNKRITIDALIARLFQGMGTNCLCYFDGTKVIAVNGLNTDGAGRLLVTSLLTDSIDTNSGPTQILNVIAELTGAEVHAQNGFSGSGTFTSFTIVDGVITAAS